jgi:hypothetical protein
MSDPQGVPSEEELRAAYEAELARISATDMIAQATVSLLNIGARRMGPPTPAPGAEPGAGEGAAPPERDLEQVRDTIDAAMALLAILERRIPADQLAPLRDALSRLQMAYAGEVRGGEPPAGGKDPGGGGDQGGAPGGSGGEPQPAPGDDQAPPGQRRPGPAESSGRLWVPGS